MCFECFLLLLCTCCLISHIPLMASLILLFLIPILVSFLFQKYKTRNYNPWPPGPKGLPLVGNLHQIDNSHRPRYFWKLSKQYGPLMYLRLGFVPTLVVSSAKMAQEILKTHDLHFCSRPPLLGVYTLSYGGSDLAYAPYNDHWRELRKICTIHLFSSIKVQQFRPMREDEVSRMIQNISKSTSSAKPINLSTMMTCLSIAVTCRVAFGKRFGDEGIEKNKFHELLHETQDGFLSFYLTDYFPFMGWVDKLTGNIYRLQKTFKKLDAFYQQLIDEHLDPNRPKTGDEDILDVLLQLKKDRGFKVDITWDHIKGLLMDIFIAGADTSAITVIWAMTYLMQNPPVRKKAQDEIRTVIGNKGLVDEDDVQKLTYLKAVVKETLRLQPAVPILPPREAIEKCRIDGYEIPLKTRVYVNSWAVGRDPEAWDDPEKFYPERFIDSSIDFIGQNFELLPFGGGRRICAGMYMGLGLLELALANLLYKFDWELPDGMETDDIDFEALPGVAMYKKNHLCLVATNHI